MKQVYLEQYKEGGYRNYRVPAIIVTSKGSLLVCYECRHGDDWSTMDMALRRSTDGGETWEERARDYYEWRDAYGGEHDYMAACAETEAGLYDY